MTLKNCEVYERKGKLEAASKQQVRMEIQRKERSIKNRRMYGKRGLRLLYNEYEGL